MFTTDLMLECDVTVDWQPVNHPGSFVSPRWSWLEAMRDVYQVLVAPEKLKAFLMCLYKMSCEAVAQQMPGAVT